LSSIPEITVNAVLFPTGNFLACVTATLPERKIDKMHNNYYV